MLCYVMIINSFTHFSQMEFPILIHWNNPFPFEGLLGSNFHFYSNFNRTFCVQTVKTGDPNQISHNAASDLGLYCLHMSLKKDARLTWVNFE